MSQGFVNPLPIPVPFSKGGTNSTSSAWSPASINFTSTTGIIGATTNNNAAAGSVGEFISSVIPNASAVALTTSVIANITSISLTAGDWDVYANVFLSSSAQTMQLAYAWTSTVSATIPDASLIGNIQTNGVSLLAAVGPGIPTLRYSLSTTTTVYLSVDIVFTGGTGSGSGGIYARRIR